MSMTKDEALKMAIKALDDLELCDYATAHKAIQACKEALEHPAQEPTWIVNDTAGTKLRQYTHPAPSWQGLSDDEVDDIWFEVVKENNFEGTGKYFWRAIERALKEKNT